MNRRSFVQLAGATLLAATAGSVDAEQQQAKPQSALRPLPLGMFAIVPPGGTIDATIKLVHDLGLPTCQIFISHLKLADAEPLLQAESKYEVEVTAVSEHSPGPRRFNFYEGPLTVGIIPPDNPYRSARIDALKVAAEVARRCNIPAVHTHLGCIPENPNDPVYLQAIVAIREVAEYCRERGRMLLCETGEETPLTMLRMIEDVGTGNAFVNMDTANLISGGKGNPVDAMDVVGHLVRGVHAKDSLFPTDPRVPGEEVQIGKGKVDFPEFFRRLREVNYTGAITIEREIKGPQQERDIRASEPYLRKLIAMAYQGERG